MILRRLTEHVKAQNWFAVAIDFVIVVAGVFVGMQVNNWNEERRIRAGERVYLVRMRTDFGVDIEKAREKAAYLQTVAAAGRRTLDFIDAGKPCAEACWRVLVDFFAASQWRDVAPSPGVLDDLRASRYPYDEPLKRRIIDYYSFMDQMAEVIERPDYRKLVRSLIPVSAQTPLWATCHEGGGDRQRIILNCPGGVPDDTAREIVETLRQEPEILKTLTYYASITATVAVTMEAEADAAAATLALIDARIARRR